MAYTTANAPNLEVWERSYFSESIREAGFKAFMGTSPLKPIVTKEELVQGGQVIHVPLVMALRKKGIGTGTLTGNEEKLNDKNYDLKPYWHRHAMTVKKSEKHKSSIDLVKAMREVLKLWEVDEMRDGIVNAFSSVIELSGAYEEEEGHPKEVFMSEATDAQLNTFAAANEHRLWFGSAESNYNADWSTALATVNDSADVFKADRITDLKVKAKKRLRTKMGDAVDVPSIRPIRTGEEGKEFFIAFTDSLNFRKLKQDDTMKQANREARPREVASNPIFNDGDLYYDGVIIREVPEIRPADTNVSPVYFCGAQALGMAWGQRPRVTTRDDKDYGFIEGFGTEALWSAEKLRFNGMDHGVITGFFYTA